MPDSYGKRQRDAVKARKAAEREERRLARRRRRDGLEIAPWEAEEQAPVAGQVAEGDEGGGEEADLDSANEHHAIDSQ
jgi:hypothetical protein